MIPFKVQFDKLTEAYISDKVEPYKECACFIGNMLNGHTYWGNIREYRAFGGSVMSPHRDDYTTIALEVIKNESDNTYTPEEIIYLENLFLLTLETETIGEKAVREYLCDRAFVCLDRPIMNHPNYEEALFKAFSVTLNALRGIHESKGEIVDDFIFTQRKLETV